MDSMSESAKNPFDIFLDAIRQVVRNEVDAALSKRQPQKLLYTTKEAAVMLNVEESWLAIRARAKLVPFRMMGHYRYFSISDIEAIINQAGIDKGGVPLVQIEHDWQGASTDSKTSRVEPIKTRGDDENDRD
jgi:hypothetical protein